MKTPFFALTVLLVLLSSTLADPVAPANDLAMFRHFFSKPEEPTIQEIQKAFGNPTRIGPLYITESDEDAKMDHAWWYYQITPDESLIGIQVDRGTVRGVFHFFKDPEGITQVEEIKKQ